MRTLELARVRIATPVLKCLCAVTFARPRKLTVFELVIIRLVDHFGQHVTYGELPLGQALREMFCIPDVDLLLQPCVDGLVNLRVLSTARYAAAIGELRLRELSVTDEGRTFVREGRLPAVERTVEETFCFDSLGGRFLSVNEARLLDSEPSGSAFRLATDQPRVPATTAVFDHLLRSEPDWLLPETHLRNAIVTQQWTLWRTALVPVEIDERGTVQFQTSDNGLKMALASAPGDHLCENLILPACQWDERPEAIELQATDPARLLSAARRIVPQKSMRGRLAQAAISLYGHPALAPQLAENGQLRIAFGFATDGERVQFSSDRSGALLRFDTRLANSIIAAHDSRNVFGSGIVVISCNGFNASAAIFWELEERASEEAWNEAITTVDKLLRVMPEVDAQLLRAHYLPGDAVWKDLLPLLQRAKQPLAATVNALLAAAGRLLRGGALAEAQREIIEFTAEHLAKTSALEPATLAVVHCFRSPQERTAVGRRLLAQLPPPESRTAWKKAWQLCRETPELRTLLGEPPFYSASLARSLLDEFALLDLQQFEPANQFEKIIADLKAVYREVEQMIHEPNFVTPDFDAWAEVMKKEAGKWPAVFAGWRRYWRDLERHPLYTNATARSPETSLQAVNRALAQFDEHLRRASRQSNPAQAAPSRVADAKPRPNPAGRTYVIDTNVFLDRPEILRLLDPADHVYLSKTVIQELDDKKRDLDCGGRAAAAIRNIRDAMSRNSARFHLLSARPGLLPPDYDLKRPDNRILAVALACRKFSPILLTSDQGLQLKAKGENIATLGLQDFINTRTDPPKTS